jgi:hypothetical protein
MINLNEHWQERRHWPVDMEKHAAVMFRGDTGLLIWRSMQL